MKGETIEDRARRIADIREHLDALRRRREADLVARVERVILAVAAAAVVGLLWIVATV